MKRNIIFMFLMICMLFFSCTQRSKLIHDSKNNHYEVSYHHGYMVISQFYQGKIKQSDTLLYKNGEYVDCMTHKVVLSTKHNYNELLDSFYVDAMNYTWKDVYKLYDYHWTPDLKALHKDIFVTDYYQTSCDVKDGRRVSKRYYYDANYRILKIIARTETDFDAQ